MTISSSRSSSLESLPARPESLRPDPASDERCYRISVGYTAGATIFGFGVSIEAGASMSVDQELSPVEFLNLGGEIKVFGEGAKELKLNKSRYQRALSGKALSKKVVSLNVGPTITISQGQCIQEMNGPFSEVAIGPVTVAPPDTNGDWSLQVAEGLGFGAREGTSYKWAPVSITPNGFKQTKRRLCDEINRSEAELNKLFRKVGRELPPTQEDGPPRDRVRPVEPKGKN